MNKQTPRLGLYLVLLWFADGDRERDLEAERLLGAEPDRDRDLERLEETEAFT